MKTFVLLASIFLFAFALILACGFGDDDDDDQADDDATDDDQDDDQVDDDDLQDDDDDADDDLIEDNDVDDDDDGYQNDNCDLDPECCANAWVLCEYLNPFRNPDCGDCPSYINWLRYRKYWICYYEDLIDRYHDLAQCGFDRGCDDWKYDYNMCWADDHYQLDLDCFYSSLNYDEYIECLIEIEYPNCYPGE